jgi:hypothetical protein
MSSVIQANVTIQGSITTLGTFGQTTYAPVDLGVNSLSLATGNLTSLITTSSSAPTGFATAGEGSLVFPGTANSYISFGPQVNVNFTLASATATFECWFYPTGSPGVNNTIFSHAPLTSGTYDWIMYIETNNKIGFYSPNPNFALYSTNTVNFNAWNHVAWSFSGGTIYIALNGVVNTGSPGSTQYTSSFSMIVGSAGPTVTGQQFSGNLTNLRIVQGAALYTATYTVPTAPLQISTSGTTRLLVRVPLATTKMVVPKLGGTNTNSVLAFPPAPMTGYSTNMTGQSYYGQGTYVASASSEYNSVGTILYAWNAFRQGASIWTSNLGYNTSTGIYTASNVTVDVTGTAYLGEWLQIQQPVSTVLSSYTLGNRTDVNYESPNTFWIFGSRDGTSWSLVNSQSGITWSTAQTKTFTVSASQAFTWYRLGVSTINAGGSSRLSIGQFTLNGTIEGPSISPDGRLGVGVSAPVQALEVAGNIVVNGTVSSQSTTFRNVLINGDMRINQRGISTTVASPSNMGTSSTAYAVDRWLCFRGSYASGGTVAQGTTASTDLPYQNDGLTNFLRIGRSVGDTSTNGINAVNALETKDSFRLAGRNVTMSFYYRTGSAFAGNFQPVIATSTGTDQNYSSAWAGSVVQAPSVLSASTSWAKYSFSAQIPVNATQVAAYVQYYPSTATAVANDYFDITGVQLEKGTVATPFEVRPFGTELALCQRYYEKSYSMGVAVGTNSTPGAFNFYGGSDGSSNMLGTVKYCVPKRTSITPSFWTQTGTANQWTYYRNGASGNSGVTVGNQNEFSFQVYAGVGAAYTVAQINGHWEANAEL